VWKEFVDARGIAAIECGDGTAWLITCHTGDPTFRVRIDRERHRFDRARRLPVGRVKHTADLDQVRHRGR
jgi:hypothetical protein